MTGAGRQPPRNPGPRDPGRGTLVADSGAAASAKSPAALSICRICVAAAALVVVGAAVLWTHLRSSPVATTETASPQRPLNAPRLSIVVLPLANLSNDPDQQYFADGITEDLTTDLSRIADMLVISRNTAFTYKNKPIDSRQIGRELGVRYVLEGSVQRSGDRVRITTQLIDAETHAHLWAERFDRDIGDLFAVQNEITRQIAVTLHQALVSAEAIRPTDHPDALEYVLRARAAWNRPPSREKWAETIDYLERALAIDPSSVAAQGWLASALSARVLDLMADSVEADIARAAALAEQALAAAPGSALPHYAKGAVLRAQNRCEQALPEYEMVLALNRNWVRDIRVAQCKSRRSDRRCNTASRAGYRISPRDPSIVVFTNIGIIICRSRA